MMVMGGLKAEGEEETVGEWEKEGEGGGCEEP